MKYHEINIKDVMRELREYDTYLSEKKRGSGGYISTEIPFILESYQEFPLVWACVKIYGTNEFSMRPHSYINVICFETNILFKDLPPEFEVTESQILEFRAFKLASTVFWKEWSRQHNFDPQWIRTKTELIEYLSGIASRGAHNAAFEHR